LVLGVAAGFALARLRFPGRELVDSILLLPMVLPPTVLGYYLLVVVGRRGWLGGWLEGTLGIRLVFTWQGAVLAAAIVAFPFVCKSAPAAFEASMSSSSRRRTCSASARRGVLPRHLAARLARHPGRPAARFRARLRRIRCDADGRGQHPRQDADALDRRLRSGAGGTGRSRQLAGAAHFGDVRRRSPARRPIAPMRIPGRS
jgi:hypothetical protein